MVARTRHAACIASDTQNGAYRLRLIRAAAIGGAVNRLLWGPAASKYKFWVLFSNTLATASLTGRRGYTLMSG